MDDKAKRTKADAPDSSRQLRVAPPADRRMWLLLLPLLIGVLSFFAYSAALDAEFVNYDDDRMLLTNPMYRGFSGHQLRWMFTTGFMGHFQPLTWLSLALDYTISGTDPSSYHRNNLILHALNAILFYLVVLHLLTVTRRGPPPLRREASFSEHPLSAHLAAALAALFYAIHPLRVESVVWASERRDVLSTFFLLIAYLTYLRSVRAGEASLRSSKQYVASIVALALSLLCKAWGMSFVVIVILLDIYPLQRLTAATWRSPRARAIWWQKLPYLLLGLAAAALAGISQHGALQTMKSLAEWSVGARIVQAFYGLAFYVGKTIWPANLVALYELPEKLDPLAARFLLSYVAVILAVVAIFLLRRRLPAVAVAAIAYAVILAPVLGFAQSGPQFVADKYSYVSCMSCAALAGAGFLWLWEHRRGLRWPLLGAALAILVVFGLLTHRQAQVWQNSERLWSHALSAGRPAAGAHLNYGFVLLQSSRDTEALEHFEKAVEIRPTLGEAWYQIGQMLRRAKRTEEAIAAYRRAAETMPLKHQAYMNLGTLLHSQGKLDEAIASARLAVQHVAPLFGSTVYTTRPYLLLGGMLRESGEYVEARRWLEVAARFPETREAAQAELKRIPGYEPAPLPPPDRLDASGESR